jgi:predicted molibdopterin-dependent oxidoreductase YjgC
MGAYATGFPGGLDQTDENARRLSELWGFDVPVAAGRTAPELVDAAGRGELDVLIAAGGNFLEVLPDPPQVERALARIPLRVHMDIVASPQMLVDPAETVVLLPATTRYEVPGGVTETSTERRVIFSPEVEGPRVPDARSEHWAFGELAARVRPELADKVRFDSTAAMRREIATVVPFYDGIQHLRAQGDSFQYGGPRLCGGWRFPTTDGRARFAAVVPPPTPAANGRLRLSTRRGKQFNSMVHERRDALTGALREAVLVAAQDAQRLGLADGDRVTVRSDHGSLAGHVLIAAVKPGNVQVHWPEGNTLLAADRRSAEAGIPDYNTWVELDPGPLASQSG